jgi:predicted transcriptional regulator
VKRRKYTIDGETKFLTEWAKQAGVNVAKMQYRLKKMTLAEAVAMGNRSTVEMTPARKRFLRRLKKMRRGLWG